RSFEGSRADDARAGCRQALEMRGDGWLTNVEVGAVLGAFGLPLAAGMVAHTAEDAAAAARVIGFPIAAQLPSRRVPHKADVRADQLNVADEVGVRRAVAAV